MGRPVRRSSGDRRVDPDEFALRALLGSGPTALPGDLALRAREVSRPGPAELAAAERDLVIRRGRPVAER